MASSAHGCQIVRRRVAPDEPWLRTNGVNTNGAAAKVMVLDRLWKKIFFGTFGKINDGSTQKVPLSKTSQFAATP